MDRSSLRQQLLELHQAALAFSRQADGLSDSARISAANLLAYVELRRHDLSQLQLELADVGLSSLGRLEGQVLN
ncbi:MAG TPA: hypothetical protein PJ994_13135, partial [Tepidiformaceae bacterium]|nr:hypothetical protein [Tepidiformaceae bacterium]